MSIVILSNNPSFIDKNNNLIKKYAIESEVFGLIKLKYFDIIKDINLKHHDIFFRSDKNGFIFGFNDYKNMLNKLNKNSKIYLINNFNNNNILFNGNENINFEYFDLSPIINFLLSYSEHPIFNIIKKYLFVNNKINITYLSTGFVIILNYFLKYPNTQITLLGFYEKNNQKVLKEGKIIKETTHHNFEDEKNMIQALIPNIIFIN
jgi:hypothetical protein